MLSDLFTVHTADGTAKVIQISITGATDGDPDDHDSLATGSSVVVDGTFVYGTTTNDVIDGSNGGQTIYAGAGNDNVKAGTGVDTIFGGSGNDIITGNNGGDSIFGGSGNDIIFGGNGPDIIIGGHGDDQLTGNTEGSGSDTFVFNLNDDHDIITDFDLGLDFVQLNIGVSAAELTAIIAASSGNTLDFGNGDAITFQGLNVQQLNTGNFILV